MTAPYTMGRVALRICAISAANADQAAHLANIHREIFATTPERSWSIGQFQSSLDDHRTTICQAFAGQRLAGLAAIRLVADEAELLTFGILPGCRRQGFAAQFLAHLITETAERGCRHLYGDVRAGNHAARQLYGAAGAKIIGQRAQYYRLHSGSREDSVSFVIPLQ